MRTLSIKKSNHLTGELSLCSLQLCPRSCFSWGVVMPSQSPLPVFSPSSGAPLERDCGIPRAAQKHNLKCTNLESRKHIRIFGGILELNISVNISFLKTKKNWEMPWFRSGILTLCSLLKILKSKVNSCAYRSYKCPRCLCLWNQISLQCH